MPSSAFASFTVHKFPLLSCSAFLETVVSFSIFLTLDYSVNLALPSACLSPQAYLLLESTRPFGSTTIYHAALDFYPPWPFFSCLIPFNFPVSSWLLWNPALSADECRSVTACSLGLPCDAAAALPSCRPDSLATCLSCDEAEGPATCFSAIPVGLPDICTYIVLVTRSFIKEKDIGGKNSSQTK